MSDIYKLQYNGMTLAYPGWNGYVGYEDVPAFKTLTVYASEGGTITASVLTGMPGDTAQITTAYDTYYRFRGYYTAGGGSLNGNVYTFGDADANISALYKVNYFTASGGWDKGSNVSAAGTGNNYTSWGYANVAAKYATVSYKTSNVPTAWYATSNRWKPNGASAYSITLHPIANFNLVGRKNAKNGNVTGAATALLLSGSTVTNQASTSVRDPAKSPGTRWTYNKTITTTTQNITFAISGRVGGKGSNNGYGANATGQYTASLTTGTWTATGIAP